MLAPWGHAESGDGLNADAGLMSNGPYSTLLAAWEWEYGDRVDVARLRGKLWPLLKGEADFFGCWLRPLGGGDDDGYLHDMHDCTSESGGGCTNRDAAMTLTLARRSLRAACELAVFLSEPVDAAWTRALEKMVPLPSGWTSVTGGSPAAAPESHSCSWCAGTSRPPVLTSGDCQVGALTKQTCANATAAGCPSGSAPCVQRAWADMVRVDGSLGLPSGGNTQSIFAVFPADAVGTNASTLADPQATATGVNTVRYACQNGAEGQGNSFTKIFSAAARVALAPGQYARNSAASFLHPEVRLESRSLVVFS